MINIIFKVLSNKITLKETKKILEAGIDITKREIVLIS